MTTTRQTRKPAAKKTSAKTSTAKVEASVKEAMEDVRHEAASILDTVRSNVVKLQDSGQQTWLAGLGVVGKSFDQAKASYTRINEERLELIHDLVTRGEKVQKEAEVRFSENRANIEQKLNDARNRITELVSDINIPGRVQDLSDTLESFGKGLKKSA